MDGNESKKDATIEQDEGGKKEVKNPSPGVDTKLLLTLVKALHKRVALVQAPLSPTERKTEPQLYERLPRLPAKQLETVRLSSHFLLTFYIFSLFLKLSLFSLSLSLSLVSLERALKRQSQTTFNVFFCCLFAANSQPVERFW
jgi:hypothetical protein